MFEMWGKFLKSRRAQRLGVYRGVMNKCDASCEENMAQRKAQKTEHEPISIEKTTS